jgi:hypothetical protein
MTRRLRSTAATLGLLLSGLLLTCAAGALVDDGAPDSRKYCTESKPFRDVAEDDTTTVSELCAWRDDSLRLGTDREMTLFQDLPLGPAT